MLTQRATYLIFGERDYQEGILEMAQNCNPTLKEFCEVMEFINIAALKPDTLYYLLTNKWDIMTAKETEKEDE